MKTRMPGRFDLNVFAGFIFVLLWLGLGGCGLAWLVSRIAKYSGALA